MPTTLTAFEKELLAKAKKLTAQFRRRKPDETHGLSNAQLTRIKSYIKNSKDETFPARIYTGKLALAERNDAADDRRREKARLRAAEKRRESGIAPRKPRTEKPKRVQTAAQKEWTDRVKAVRKMIAKEHPGYGAKRLLSEASKSASEGYDKKTKPKTTKPKTTKPKSETRKKRSDAGVKRGPRTVRVHY